MGKQLDKFVVDTLKEYGFDQSACWDCHGTWVVYHKVLEQIASKKGIAFDQPYAMSTTPDNIAICVTGSLGDKSEWSIGEAAPKNNKNAYPWAMAEKRAKDRVILKLIGLHGFVYSEDEANDFKDNKSSGEPKGNFKPEWVGPLNKVKLMEEMNKLSVALEAAGTNIDDIEAVVDEYGTIIGQAESDLPDWFAAYERKVNQLRREYGE